jgi:hypothetical protein
LVEDWSKTPGTGWVEAVAAESGTSLYAARDSYSDAKIWEVDPANGSVLDSVGDGGYDRNLEVDEDDEPVWYAGTVSRWDRTADSVEELNLDPGSPIETVPYGGDFYVGSAWDNDIIRYNSDATSDWTDSGGGVRGIDTTSNAVYGAWGSNVRKWDHNGNVQWTVETVADLDNNYDIAAGHASYVFSTGTNGSIYRIPKDGSTRTSIYTAEGEKKDVDVEVGPDDNLFVADVTGQDLHVLNADGSEILTKTYGSVVRDVEARADGVYVVAGSSLYKYTKSGF